MGDRDGHDLLERILAGSEAPKNLPLATLESITDKFGCGYFTVNRTEDFPTVRLFLILVSFLLFSDFKKKKLRKKRQKILTRKILERKI